MTGWIGTLTDIHDEKQVEAERELVSQELDHRIKNFFALTKGLVSLTARENLDDAGFAERLQGRLTALHHSHDLIRQKNSAEHGQTLLALLRHLLAPYALSQAMQDHIMVAGDDVDLTAQDATAFALVFHELATNAAKYGPLSSADGLLQITATHRNGMLTLDWREKGGSGDKKASSGGGFGSRLINMIIERQMSGRFERIEESGGVSIRLEIPRP